MIVLIIITMINIITIPIMDDVIPIAIATVIFILLII